MATSILQIPLSLIIPSPTPTHELHLLLLPHRTKFCPKKLQQDHHHHYHPWRRQFSRRTLKCFSSKKQSSDSVEEDQQVYELERLFSNVNQVTLKREPGSLTSSILLVAGTTVGAGILAIPAVTQDAGFLASVVTCIFCWAFMVVTGLLVAEVNVSTMCELGSGGVSLVSMARRTLGTVGVQVVCWSYIFIHYALLVAYVDRSSDILTNFLGIPLIVLNVLIAQV